MTFHVTELIASQTKTVIVMCAAGISIESLWIIKKYLEEKTSHVKIFGCHITKGILETAFWILAAITYSMFQYYCTYGQITLHGTIGFLTGLLLWKKICCGILKAVWAEKEEVENLKTTAKLSISKKRENKGWKKGKLNKEKKKNVRNT